MAYYDGEILKQILGKKLNEFEKLNVPISEVAIKIGQAIKEAPTADVVEVVRCKDCRYFTKGTLWEICKLYSTNQVERIVQKDHFCSYGERRDD